MAGLLESVDQRTKLAGHNRLELLLFKLDEMQLFGINVFKVQEVIHCPKLTRIPQANPVVCGVANMRGKTISVIDLAKAVGKPAIMNDQNEIDKFVIITEYNRVVQGFLVYSVERIVNVNWEKIHAPPPGTGLTSYLTAVTRIDESLIEILDVEKILAEVSGCEEEVSEEIVREHAIAPQVETSTAETKDGVAGDEIAGAEGEVVKEVKASPKILVADDSSVARKQIQKTLKQINLECIVAKNGAEALDLLLGFADAGTLYQEISMVISDVEMPEMDGYTLTTEIRRDSRLADLYVMLHTSLSGVFNQNMVRQVGADNFIAKFNPDELATGVFEALEATQALRK